MNREEACFIHNGEIYYRIGASDEEINQGLQSMVNDAVYDDYDDEANIWLQAQMYLIKRQKGLIMNKYCE